MAATRTAMIVLQFAFATLLPVFAGATLTVLSQRSPLCRMGYWPRQILYGIVFGIIAVFGTEFGINTHDATMNVRDAAPMVAGLYFGSPAGIIAGIIGGVERWFSVLWGRGMFTRVACSVATIAVGFYAALLNRIVFNNKKPSWPLALTVGMVAEVLHLLLVFLTNFDQASHAFKVVQACSVPMVSCNGISVALSGAAIAIASGHSIRRAHTTRDISQTIQSGMLAVVAVGFIATVGFTFTLQQSISVSETTQTLELEIRDVREDIHNASDENLLDITKGAAILVPTVAEATNDQLAGIADSLDVAEISVIDSTGTIVASSSDYLVGFDMHSGQQSRAFLDLLPNGRSDSYVQSYRPMTIDETQLRKYAGVRIDGGFVQVGYDSEQFLDDISSQVQESVANRHVGSTGFLVVFGENGTLVGTRGDIVLREEDTSRILRNADAAPRSTVFETNYRSKKFFAMHEDVEGLHMVAMLPVEEAIEARDLAVLVTSFMEVIVFAALFAAIYVLIHHVVVSSIWEVNGTLQKITSGDLEAKVNVRDSTEFASLSDDINRTVGALRDAIAAESARIERDLATAKAIQQSALPTTFPPFPEIHAFDIYASMNAAREVGGDFYDFFLIDDHTLGFLIADVSGKGIPASLFMMSAKSELANYMRSGMNLAEAVHSANWNLCQGNDAGMFVTVWAATLNYSTGELTYVNAGHNPPLLRHDGKWEWLKKKGGLFLGTFETAKYRQSSLTLELGDELLLYTDGVNEAFSVDEEEYGNDRLEEFLNNHANLHPHVLVEMLRADVRRWAHGAEQSDDITILSLEYGVPPEVSGNISVPATLEGLAILKRRLHFELSQLQCPENVQAHIDLTVEELFTNIYQYGYVEKDESNKVQLSYLYSTNPIGIVISITDWGVPFNPLSWDGPKEGVGDEVTGMGIALAGAKVDDMTYIRDEDRNIVAFRKLW